MWLPAGTDPEETVADFRRRLEAQNILAVPGDVRFPERSVLLVRRPRSS